MSDYDIVVLRTPHRKPVIEEYLSDIKHFTYMNLDWEFSQEEVDKISGHERGLCAEHPTAFRCFRGHQEALKMVLASQAPKGTILMLEDDARPRPNWQETVEKSLPLLAEYEVVSLHARSMSWIDRTFVHQGLKFKVPGKHKRMDLVWALGTLSYLVSAEVAQDIIEDVYIGRPMDIYLPNRFSYCALDEKTSPFLHDQKHGSHFAPHRLGRN